MKGRREGWRNGGMKGWRDGGREVGRDGGREGGMDGGMEGRRDGEMEGGMPIGSANSHIQKTSIQAKFSVWKNNFVYKISKYRFFRMWTPSNRRVRIHRGRI